jgi:ribosome-binding protein aMBF1 (putative translation factor)
MEDQTPTVILASILPQARQRLALDQVSLAELASVPLTRIEQAERGEITKLDAVSAERLAGTLGIRTEELLR